MAGGGLRTNPRADRGDHPGFAGFDHRLHRPGGFYLGNAAARREWSTASGRAEFKAHALPADLLPERARRAGIGADLILQTLRSHDQYNTTLYGLDDRYRGVRGCARWCSSTRRHPAPGP